MATPRRGGSSGSKGPKAPQTIKERVLNAQNGVRAVDVMVESGIHISDKTASELKGQIKFPLSTVAETAITDFIQRWLKAVPKKQVVVSEITGDPVMREKRDSAGNVIMDSHGHPVMEPLTEVITTYDGITLKPEASNSRSVGPSARRLLGILTDDNEDLAGENDRKASAQADADRAAARQAYAKEQLAKMLGQIAPPPAKDQQATRLRQRGLDTFGVLGFGSDVALLFHELQESDKLPIPIPRLVEGDTAAEQLKSAGRFWWIGPAIVLIALVPSCLVGWYILGPLGFVLALFGVLFGLWWLFKKLSSAVGHLLRKAIPAIDEGKFQKTAIDMCQTVAHLAGDLSKTEIKDWVSAEFLNVVEGRLRREGLAYLLFDEKIPSWVDAWLRDVPKSVDKPESDLADLLDVMVSPVTKPMAWLAKNSPFSRN